MTLVAVEPKREVADWLRLRCRGSGSRRGGGRPFPGPGTGRRGDIRYLAGYLGGGGTVPIFPRPVAGVPRSSPFTKAP